MVKEVLLLYNPSWLLGYGVQTKDDKFMLESM